jgi:anti-sigma factor RsiW
MTPEVLQRLLIDHKLGEMSDDVADLLAAYMQMQPDAATEAEEISDTIELARRASAPEAELDAPPPMPPGLHLDNRTTSNPVRTWTRAAAVAAAVVGAFFLGSSFSLPPAPTNWTTVVAMSAPAHDSDAEPGGFWSLKRLQHNKPRDEMKTPHIEWSAPWLPSRIGGRS